MRILIIVDCYYPTTKSSAKLVHDLGAEFRRRGNEVTILAPSETIREPLEVSIEDGLRIARVKTGKIKGASKLFRAINEVRLSETLWRKGKKFLEANPCDLILFYSPSIFFGPLVRRLKSLWNCPSYLILRDIFPQWAVDAGVLSKGIIYSYFRKRELDQYSAADVIAVQTPSNLKYFSTQLPNKNYRLEVLFNWTTLHEEGVPRSSYRQQLGLEDKVVFFYGGNIGVAQDMDNIVRLAISMREYTQVYFLLVGEGSEVSRLNGLLRANEINNMKILPAVGQQEYLAMLSEFDVGILSLDRRLQTQNVPGKLLGYLYYSMPVLASLNPGNDLRDILDESESGLCSTNGEDALLLESALRLASDAELRTRLGKNARKLLEKTFSVSAAADTILGHVGPLLHPDVPKSSLDLVKN